MLAIRVAGELEKDGLLALDADVFFKEPHYDGYPAVLVNLKAVGVRELRELIVESWRVKAPTRVLQKYGDEL